MSKIGIKKKFSKLTPSKVNVLKTEYENSGVFSALKNSNVAIWQWDTQTCELTISSNFFEMLEYDYKKLIGDFKIFFSTIIPTNFLYTTLKTLVKAFYSKNDGLNTAISLNTGKGELKALILRGKKENFHFWTGTVFFSCYSSFGTHTCQAPFINFFENSKQAVVVFDFNGQIINANKVAKQYFKPAPNSKCEHISYYFKQLDKEMLKKLKKEVYGFKKAVLTSKFNNHQGLKIPWELDIRFANYHNKKCFVAVLNDIKDKLMYLDKLKQAKNLLENTINGLPIAVYAVESLTGNIIFWNKTCELFFNKSVKSVIHKPIKALKKDKSFTVLLNADEETIKTEITNEIVNHSFNNAILGNRIFNTIKIPLFNTNGNLTYILSVTNDDTERIIAEESLKKSQEKLAKANSVKDRLFSVIGHDLRGPVGNMSLVMKMLLESKFDAEESNEILAELRVTAEETYQLLEHLLTWARSQRGTVNPKKVSCDLQNMINHIIELFTTTASNKKIVLIKNLEKDLPKVWADANMLDTVIRNLVSNALKFTSEDDTITIKAKVIEDNIKVDIIDTGIGMTKDDLAKLFRADVHIAKHGTNQEKGTGLGLLLCKDFVEINSGTIKADSILKKGSTFTFTVPIFNNQQ